MAAGPVARSRAQIPLRLCFVLSFSSKHFQKVLNVKVEDRCLGYKIDIFRFLVGAFRRKTQTIVMTFFKTNEVADFISWLPLTATLM